MKTLGQSLSENEINMMMKEADKNRDGKIDYDGTYCSSIVYMY